jgi:hypothetical protein
MEVILKGNNMRSGKSRKQKQKTEPDLHERKFSTPPDLYFASVITVWDIGNPDNVVEKNHAGETRLSAINPQQKDYLWGTAELVSWKSLNGKDAKGVLYKPENFDPKKKYPMICYFYEDLDNSLNNYIPPAPIRSAINISFFVSRGYLILFPV